MKRSLPSHGFLVALFLASVLAWTCASTEEPLALDRFGGLTTPNFGPGKFFRVHDDGQRFWLATPEGGAFLSLGACVVNSVGDAERGTSHHPYRENVLKKHGSVDKWIATTKDRFKEWGLNTLGGWSSEELRDSVPYTIELSVSSGIWGGGRVPDMFSAQAEEHIRKGASGIDKHVDDPYLIGYYLDNELPWSYDWRRQPDIFPGYVAMPAEAPGKQRLVEFFKERYQTIEQFSKVWRVSLKDWNELASVQKLKERDGARAKEDREAFVLLVARKYFQTATEAIRAKDQNHLILGCRFVWCLVPRPAVQACGEYCDVVSVNYYEAGIVGRILLSLTDSGAMRVERDLSFKAFYDLAKKPLLVTEFSFRAIDSGMPNTYPPGWLLQPKVATQKFRADKFEECATTWMTQPYFVGYHWFEYMDEPKAGRFDGENGNYGLVNIEDEPYTEFVDRFKSVNRRVWDLHAASGAK